MRRGHLAELAGEVGLHVGGEVLAGEEQHQVPAQGATHFGHHGVAQGTAEVEATHLGSDVGGDRPDVETRRQRHGSIVPQPRNGHNPSRPGVPAGSATPEPHIVWPRRQRDRCGRSMP